MASGSVGRSAFRFMQSRWDSEREPCRPGPSWIVSRSKRDSLHEPIKPGLHGVRVSCSYQPPEIPFEPARAGSGPICPPSAVTRAGESADPKPRVHCRASALVPPRGARHGARHPGASGPSRQGPWRAALALEPHDRLARRARGDWKPPAPRGRRPRPRGSGTDLGSRRCRQASPST